MTPVPVIICGPSGVGKNAVIDRILPMFAQLEPFKTTTSRPRRTPHDDKYHFVSRADFERLIDEGKLLEWEETHGNLYGTQRTHIETVLAAGKYPVPQSAVDVRGVASYTKVWPETLAIFLTFESLEDLPGRLRRTRPEATDKEIETRLDTARREMATVDQFEHVVANREGKLDETVEQVATIIERELHVSMRHPKLDSGSSRTKVLDSGSSPE